MMARRYGASSEADDLPARGTGSAPDKRRIAAAGRAARTPALGSNSWAVAGRLTATGAALVANDMHLTQRVPATCIAHVCDCCALTDLRSWISME